MKTNIDPRLTAGAAEYVAAAPEEIGRTITEVEAIWAMLLVDEAQGRARRVYTTEGEVRWEPTGLFFQQDEE